MSEQQIVILQIVVKGKLLHIIILLFSNTYINVDLYFEECYTSVKEMSESGVQMIADSKPECAACTT